MDTKTTELRGQQAMRAIFTIDAARCGKLKVGEDVMSVKHRGRALMVIPVNESPFVLIDQTQDPAPGCPPLQVVSRVEFVPEVRNGTDLMRARAAAELLLETVSIKDVAIPEASTDENLVRVILVTRDLCGDEVRAAMEWMQENKVEWSHERYQAAQLAADEAWR